MRSRVKSSCGTTDEIIPPFISALSIPLFASMVKSWPPYSSEVFFTSVATRKLRASFFAVEHGHILCWCCQRQDQIIIPLNNSARRPAGEALFHYPVHRIDRRRKHEVYPEFYRKIYHYQRNERAECTAHAGNDGVVHAQAAEHEPRPCLLSVRTPRRQKPQHTCFLRATALNSKRGQNCPQAYLWCSTVSTASTGV